MAPDGLYLSLLTGSLWLAVRTPPPLPLILAAAPALALPQLKSLHLAAFPRCWLRLLSAYALAKRCLSAAFHRVLTAVLLSRPQENYRPLFIALGRTDELPREGAPSSSPRARNIMAARV